MSCYVNLTFFFYFFSEHFPYFKTAPAGWKNSVRHNLSLNKCFEKIEKPSVGGANQRKGCLWAMNPAKINKMDEEVLKWSRKDPMAIKKGMVHPRKSCLFILFVCDSRYYSRYSPYRHLGKVGTRRDDKGLQRQYDQWWWQRWQRLRG